MSSQTCWSTLKGLKLSFLLSIIRLRANSWAAIASSRSFCRALSLSSTAGNLVCSKVVGIAIGELPNISSKEVLVRSECCRLLCVNSIVPVFLCQSVGFEEQ